jgi:hypothetical protein
LTTLQYLNVQVALGETGEIDLNAYATMASTMLRIGSRLGLSRRSIDSATGFELLQERQDNNDAPPTHSN